MKWEKGAFIITDRREALDDEMIYRFLSERSYWSQGIPKAIVVKALDNSLCFGVFQEKTQVGFGRIVTDRATFGYLSDVFILESYRGLGLGKWLVECMMSHPELGNLRRWMLATGDAHRLYQQYGFRPLGKPDMLMEKLVPDIY
ncbi:MAG: GNAT family N-acetyltransferase [Cyanobacteria bacterium P01_F01_bin.86]